MRRYQLQFGLRMLMLLVIAASVGFALIGKRMSDRNAQRAVVASIERLEGQVVYQSQWDQSTETIKIMPTPQRGWLSKWIDEVTVDEVVAVTYNLNQFYTGPGFYGVSVSFPDESLSVLAGLPQLQYLYLTDTAVNEQALVHLNRLPRLSVIDLSGTEISDAGLVHLQALTSLKGLDISRTKITAAGASRLCRALPDTAIVHDSHPMLGRLLDDSMESASGLRTDWTDPGTGGALACRMEVGKVQSFEGETVRMAFTVANVDRHPITYQVPQLPNTQLSPLDCRLRENGERIRPAELPATAPSFVRLAPGEAHTFRFSVGEARDIPSLTELYYEYRRPGRLRSRYLLAGHYSIQFQYFGRCYGRTPEGLARNRLLQQNDSWSGSLTTNPLEIDILPDRNGE